MYATFDPPEDPFFMLDNVRAAIEGQETLIRALRMKFYKTMDDWQDIESAETELQRLSAMEQSYEMALQAMPSSSSSNSFLQTGASSHEFQPEGSFASDFNHGTSYNSEQYPSFAPTSFRDAPSYVHSDPTFVPTPTKTPSTSEQYQQYPRFTPPSFPVAPPYVHLDHTFIPTPTNHNTTARPPYNNPIPPTFMEQNARVDMNAARASCSHQVFAPQQAQGTRHFSHNLDLNQNPQAASPRTPPDAVATSEDEFSSYTSEEENVPNAMDLLNRIGVKAPLPVLDDTMDENGDYYGRGRDLFDGPRAAPNELVFSS
jgi:hypothetical protein